MKKAISILISGGLLVSASMAFAAQEPVAGQSVLKLDDNPVRGARQALSAIDVEIAKVDQQIVEAQNSAAVYKALPNNGLRSSQADAQTVALQIQRDGLVRERVALQAAVERAAE